NGRRNDNGDNGGANAGGGGGSGRNSGLPVGWTSATDEESGQTYYYSDRRSTWTRPDAPATP
ncbi:unnamed protein product, partial [Phaeothamnion confervicola]